jgi:hypothetical protein
MVNLYPGRSYFPLSSFHKGFVSVNLNSSIKILLILAENNKFDCKYPFLDRRKYHHY